MAESELMTKAKSKAAAVREYASRLTRKKLIDTDVMETNLRRCLNTADITMLAIGHMVGSGVYVLSATVSKYKAGPAIIIAFMFSGFASFLAALCYAELGVRYPRSGSAYSYTYLAMGELAAFLVGWNVALEHVIGAAAIARACSSYIDSLVHGAVSKGTIALTGEIDQPFMAKNLDFLAMGILILFVVFLSFGVRMTSVLNNVFSVINLCVILTIIIVGAYFSDFSNWTNPETSGFMPFGWRGVFAASATCFYAYVGFDSIASSGEEAKNPQKSIPMATMISMLIATVTYVAVSAVLTLMVNYKDIHEESGLPDALAVHGAYWAKTVVILGAVSGMSTGIIGSLFALTRVIYVMADDGLLFAFCSNVHSRTQIPITAMCIFSAISAILALTLDLDTLVEVMSIGTLFAYLVVSASVIVLRYRTALPKVDSQELSSVGERSPDDSTLVADDPAGKLKDKFHYISILAERCPVRLINISIAVFVACSFMLCGVLTWGYSGVESGSWWAIFLIVVLIPGLILPLMLIYCHHQSTEPLKYKVPLVPLVPALSVFINALLIVNLKVETWLRLFIWVAIGLAMYFSYGVGHSKVDVQSSKSKLLKSNSAPPTTWGSLEHESSFGVKPQSFRSQENLVENTDKSP